MILAITAQCGGTISELLVDSQNRNSHQKEFRWEFFYESIKSSPKIFEIFSCQQIADLSE